MEHNSGTVSMGKYVDMKKQLMAADLNQEPKNQIHPAMVNTEALVARRMALAATPLPRLYIDANKKALAPGAIAAVRTALRITCGSKAKTRVASR